MKLNLLLTGNEIMAGDVIDSNSARIAQPVSYTHLTLPTTPYV